MSVTPEELAAYADGQLEEPRRAQVEAAIAQDPALATEVARHRQLKSRLSSHFSPVLDAPVPERLSDLLGGAEPVVADLAAEREKRAARAPLSRWAWLAGPAIAAALVLALMIPRLAGPAGSVDAQTASALDGQLVAAQSGEEDVRILLSFRDEGGEYCRVFAGATSGGIACHDDSGWKLRYAGHAASQGEGDYRQAGSEAADLLARAQDMAAGPALDASEEAAARANGWR